MPVTHMLSSLAVHHPNPHLEVCFACTVCVCVWGGGILLLMASSMRVIVYNGIQWTFIIFSHRSDGWLTEADTLRARTHIVCVCVCASARSSAGDFFTPSHQNMLSHY